MSENGESSAFRPGQLQVSGVIASREHPAVANRKADAILRANVPWTRKGTRFALVLQIRFNRLVVNDFGPCRECMRVVKDLAAMTAEFQGKIFYFCTEACREKFIADLEAYAASAKA